MTKLSLTFHPELRGNVDPAPQITRYMGAEQSLRINMQGTDRPFSAFKIVAAHGDKFRTFIPLRMSFSSSSEPTIYGTTNDDPKIPSLA